MYFIGGDQMPTTMGLVRLGSLLALYPQDKIRYVIHDIDACVFRNHKTRQGIFVHPVIHGSGGVWVTIEWRNPFQSFHLRNDPIVEKLIVDGKKALSRRNELMGWLRRRFPSHRRGLFFADKQVTMLDMDFNLYPQLKEIILAEFVSEGQWAVELASDKIEATARLNILRQTLASILKASGNMFEVMEGITNFFLGGEVRLERFSTEFRLGNERVINLLNLFIKNPDIIHAYNDIVCQQKKHLNGELPFFVLFKNDRSWVRLPVIFESRTVQIGELKISGIKRAEQLVNVLGRDDNVLLVPKALLLLVYMASEGYLYFTHLSYLKEAEKLAQLLGIRLHLAQITYDFEEILGDYWPPKDILLSTDYWKLEKGFSDIQHRARDMLLERSLKAAKEKSSLVFLYVLGGRDLIYKTFKSAKIKLS